MIFDEKGHGLVPVPAPVLLHVPVMGADMGEKPLHLRLVLEEAAVEIARVPAQQNVADIEHDRGRRTHGQVGVLDGLPGV